MSELNNKINYLRKEIQHLRDQTNKEIKQLKDRVRELESKQQVKTFKLEAPKGKYDIDKLQPLKWWEKLGYKFVKEGPKNWSIGVNGKEEHRNLKTKTDCIDRVIVTARLFDKTLPEGWAGDIVKEPGNGKRHYYRNGFSLCKFSRWNEHMKVTSTGPGSRYVGDCPTCTKIRNNWT